ncbi:MAG: cytidylyltransferase domain-containing protein [Phycisphaerae bacterium]
MIHNQHVVAMVPMKAHSERVPNKNIRTFAGKPLFHWILETLEKTYAIDQILVDTDSEEIATEADRLFEKVRILPRPEALCGDFVSMNDIIDYDSRQVESDIYLQTHSTNPLLKSATVSEAFGSAGRPSAAQKRDNE